MFVKVFTSEKYARQFIRNGCMKWSTLDYFNKLDDIARGDLVDGRVLVGEDYPFIETSKKLPYNVFFGAVVEGYIYSIALVKEINDDVLDTLASFGNDSPDGCAVVIKNPNELIKRVEDHFHKSNLYHSWGKYIESVEGFFPSVFHLKMEKRNQVEYRFFLNKDTDEDFIFPEIGPLGDIAELVELSSLREFLSCIRSFDTVDKDVPFTEEHYISKITMLRIKATDGGFLPVGTKVSLRKLNSIDERIDSPDSMMFRINNHPFDFDRRKRKL